MHRTEGENNDSGLFTDGPPGTAVEQNWLNAVQEEICNVIEYAGLTVETAVTDTRLQLYNAILLFISGASLTGYIERPRFERIDWTHIDIHPGIYRHCGSADQMVKWDGAIRFEFGPLGSNPDSEGLLAGDVWYYLYLDDSAIVTAGTNTLTASEFVAVTTAPTWSNTKHGWYNGNDRCIFAVKTYAALAALEYFLHDGGEYVSYGACENDLALTDIDMVGANVALSIPNFGAGTQAQCVFYTNYVAAGDAGYLYYSLKDAPGGTHHRVGWCGAGTTHSVCTDRVVVDSLLEITVNFQANSNCTAAVDTLGWYIPRGM
uniref:Putative tail fiber protein n=1 Tax=viral metagenome TaxID=1070528 RepID=A0A6M3IU07_9ZZZZ